jgi:23S rRNA G2445 N2-methylase RlmL
MRRETFLATCGPGIEPYLLAEARALRLSKTEGRPGGVHFTGTIRDAWKANLHLRTASRVLLQLARYDAPDAQSLHAGALEVEWERYLRPAGSFAVQVRTRNSALGHAVYVAQCVKDAVADRFRERTGRRPDVDLDDPDLRIHARLLSDRVTLFADTSGQALHRRGWRTYLGGAPLKENLAAACLMAAEWDGRSPLLDPFCGSGTILVEGAMMAGGVPPGVRRGFGFERWPGHDRKRWEAEVGKAREEGAVPKKLILRGWDADPATVEGARENLAAAGIEANAEVERAPVGEFAPKKGWNAWVVTNPPYGERSGKKSELAGVYRKLGEVLRRHCGGYRAAVLSGNPDLARHLGIEPRSRVALKNGPIDCELLLLDLPR